MRYDAAAPDWPDRDRFVLSAGHASILLYSMLHLTGYGLTLDDLGSSGSGARRRPATPRSTTPPGVEVTTGPLGQGFANAVGMGIAERWLAGPLRRRAVRPPHLRHLQRRRPDGGRQPRGRLARRPPRPRPARRTSTTTTTSRSTAPPSWPSPTTPPGASRPTAGTSTSSARSPTTSTPSRPRCGGRPPSRRPRRSSSCAATSATRRPESPTRRGPRQPARRRRGPPRPRRSSACRRTRRSGCPTTCSTSTARPAAGAATAREAWEKRLAGYERRPRGLRRLPRPAGPGRLGGSCRRGSRARRSPPARRSGKRASRRSPTWCPALAAAPTSPATPAP